MSLRRAGVVCATLAFAFACTPIKPVPLSSAPVNACPCDSYDALPGSAAPRCQSSRCEVATAGNRPEFPFWVVVNVPNTSSYAAGATYVFYSDEKGAPTFTRKATVAGQQCIAPLCVSLDVLALTTGNYTVSSAISLRAGYPLDDGAAIPVRVEYDPVKRTTTDPIFPALPLQPAIVFPRLGPDPDLGCTDVCAEFAAALPAGVYQRTMYPQPPFDALFPPRADANQQIGIASTTVLDKFVLNVTTLDPAVGRTVTVNRAEGLDGWNVSIVDTDSQRRISTLKTLAGKSATVQLDTTNQQNPAGGGGLAEDVAVVVAPPSSAIAVPTFVTPVIGGQQFEIDYPYVPPPVPVQGVVAEPTAADAGAQLFGYQAKVTFASSNIATPRAAQKSSTLLQYTTEVETDVRGQFRTVLPPGTYTATTEPAEGTGFASSRAIVVVDVNKTGTALTLQPPPRTKVTGRVVLTDKRPLADADIVALPQTPLPGSLTPKPRPGTSHTQNDGSYEIELDQGQYVLTVVPKVGSGFPRVVSSTNVPADTAELPNILVPPPTPLSFTIRDPTRGENPIPHAIVRIFAVPGISSSDELAAAIQAGTLGAPVEIGEAMTDANGLVEILLAPGPR